MNRRALILAGGNMDLDYVRKYLQTQHFDLVACADSGLDAAYRLKLPVDYILGDFDSVSPEVLQQYRGREAEGSERAQVVQHSCRKDATDTHLLLEWVLEQKPEELVILGATGGRLDHFLANLNLLMLPLVQGIPAYLIDSRNKIYLIDRKHVIYREKLHGRYISLQPLTEKVTGVTLRGFQYPLEDFTLTIGDSRGVSNELEEGALAGEIALQDGILIVIESSD